MLERFIRKIHLFKVVDLLGNHFNGRAVRVAFIRLAKAGAQLASPFTGRASFRERLDRLVQFSSVTKRSTGRVYPNLHDHIRMTILG